MHTIEKGHIFSWKKFLKKSKTGLNTGLGQGEPEPEAQGEGYARPFPLLVRKELTPEGHGQTASQVTRPGKSSDLSWTQNLA